MSVKLVGSFHCFVNYDRKMEGRKLNMSTCRCSVYSGQKNGGQKNGERDLSVFAALMMNCDALCPWRSWLNLLQPYHTVETLRVGESVGVDQLPPVGTYGWKQLQLLPIGRIE